MAAPKPTIFKAPKREAILAQIGDEKVDLTRISMGTLIEVLQLVGDDPTEIRRQKFADIVAAVAVLCQPSNENVTVEYLLGLDAFTETMPFMEFAMNIIKERSDALKSAGKGDPKNQPPSSTS